MLKSGFFNALLVNGTYDRKYNAEDYSANMGAIISSGVRRDGNNGLRVTANGFNLTVSPGWAWIEGHWAHNDSVYSLPTVTPLPGDLARLDAVVLRLNTNESVRNITFEYITGIVSGTPVAPTPVRTGGVYDIVLAHIRVTATAVTVIDKRADKNVCGWITTPIGYDDFFENLDAEFNEWLHEKKDSLASVTLFKEYTWRTVLSSATNTVVFDIPQYDPTGVDIINVYVNGFREVEGVDYTLNGRGITFLANGAATGLKSAGTEIFVTCYKSIDGTGLGTIVDRLTTLENNVSRLSAEQADSIYVCNGVNDNVLLSEVVRTWLNGGTDYGCKKIKVYGTFGATAAASGAGTSDSPYVWIYAGVGSATNRKVILDFSNCSQINLNCPDNSYNVILFGLRADVIGANIVATGGKSITMFSTAAATQANAENCRFWVTSKGGYIARGGTLRDCRCSVTTNEDNAYCFNTLNGGILRLFGGEFYAYAPTGGMSAVIYVNAAQTGAVVTTYSISCPTSARSGYVQTYAVNCLTADALCSFTDTITNLEVLAEGQNIRGTIKQSRPGLS